MAIGIAVFCLIGIFGMLPVGLKSNQASIGQTVANGILSEIAADLRTTPAPAQPEETGTSLQFSIPIPASPVSTQTSFAPLYFTSDGQLSRTGVQQSEYLVTITCLQNGQNPKAATLMKLQVSWPSVVAAANAEGSVQTVIALDRN